MGITASNLIHGHFCETCNTTAVQAIDFFKQQQSNPRKTQAPRTSLAVSYDSDGYADPEDEIEAYMEREAEERDWRDKHEFSALHHKSREALSSAAQSGCYICRALDDAAKRRRYATNGRRFEIRLNVVTLSNFHFDIETGSYDDSRWGPITIRTIDPHSDEAKLIAKSHESDIKFQLALGGLEDGNEAVKYDIGDLVDWWINDCTTTHPGCSGNLGAFIPTRVLDIGLDDTDVHLTHSAHPYRPYVAMSHCWGGLKGFKLLQENLVDCGNSIDTNVLSKSFRDAIAICRSCRIQYLWIDALCIIQDSASDWNQESKQMADVYRHAHFTIAATDSEDGNGGCTAFVGKSSNKTLYWPALNRLVSAYQDSQHAWLNQRHLFSRAWVLQERLLSRRMVHFTHEGMYFECTEMLASEGFLKGIEEETRFTGPNGINLPGKRKVLELKQALLECQAPSSTIIATGERDKIINQDAWDYIKIWVPLVMIYSGCGLTFPSDKLVALTAIAQTLSSSLGSYHAGHWATLFPFDLLWKGYESYDNGGTIDRYPNFVGPSWSWASFKGLVEFQGPAADPDEYSMYCYSRAQLLAVDVKHQTSNLLGAVSSAVLTIQGKLCVACPDPKSNYGKNTFKFDRMSAYNLESCFTRHPMQTRETTLRVVIVSDAAALTENLSEVYLLMLAQTQPYGRLAIWGLALVWDGDVFHRVGMFNAGKELKHRQVAEDAERFFASLEDSVVSIA